MLKLFQELGEGEIKENEGEGKEFYKCHNVPPVQ
jgi:hypothetical protein